MQFILTPPVHTNPLSPLQYVSYHPASESLSPTNSGVPGLRTASTPSKSVRQVYHEKDKVPGLAHYTKNSSHAAVVPLAPPGLSSVTESSSGELAHIAYVDGEKPLQSTADHVVSPPKWITTKASAHWAATHNHLLQNLSTLRNEIADWEEEAFRRIKQAEAELAASRAQEEENQKLKAEAEETKKFFYNKYAGAKVTLIRTGVDPTVTAPAAKLDRRATWNAGSGTATDLSAQAKPTPARRASMSWVSPGANSPDQGRRHRTRQQDVAALKELSHVMNNDIDEKWIDTILDLNPRAAKSSAEGKTLQHVSSPSRRTASNQPVSKVYSALACEHRRALRRHPKIQKWLIKFWRVFQKTREMEQALAQEEETKTRVAARVAGTPVPELSHTPTSFMSGLELLETKGISKMEFIRFYQLVHHTLSGDDVDLTFAATHDWERMVGLKKAMFSTEFGHILFEIIDLWCLTHIPEDYVAILKALYCKITTREYLKPLHGMRTSFLEASEIGVGPGFKTAPIITPQAEAIKEAQLQKLKREKLRQYQRIKREQEREEMGDDSDDEDEKRRRREEEEDDYSSEYNSDEEYQSDEDEEQNKVPKNSDSSDTAAALPLVDANGQLLSLNSAEIKFQGNRLRARESTYVSQSLLALNDTISSFHDHSNLALNSALKDEAADGEQLQLSPSAISIHSNAGLGYNCRRKTIGLKWAIVSELMEREIERAKFERDQMERRKKEWKQEAAHVLNHSNVNGNNEFVVSDTSPSSASNHASPAAVGFVPSLNFAAAQNKRASLNLDGVALGIRSPRDAAAAGRESYRARFQAMQQAKDGSIKPLNLSSSLNEPLTPTPKSSTSPASSRSPGNQLRSPRNFYSSFDEGDSDLEDEEEARFVRELRKKKVGHSWPSLQRVLSLSRKVKNIEDSWVSLVREAVQRKRTAEAMENRRQFLRYFRNLKKVATAQAKLAGITLKSHLTEDDIEMLEKIAGISFVRGEEQQAKIEAILAEREKLRQEEQAEKLKQEQELERKRAALAAEKRKRGAVGAHSAAGEKDDASSLKASPDTSPQSALRKLGVSSAPANPLPVGRRVSWRDESHSTNLADVSILAHPALSGEIKLSRAAVEAKEKEKLQREKEEKEKAAAAEKAAVSRAAKKAIVANVVNRLTHKRVCTNPAHNHRSPTASPHEPRWAYTEAGNKYPLNENEEQETEYGPDCTFEELLSPTPHSQSQHAHHSHHHVPHAHHSHAHHSKERAVPGSTPVIAPEVAMMQQSTPYNLISPTSLLNMHQQTMSLQGESYSVSHDNSPSRRRSKLNGGMIAIQTVGGFLTRGDVTAANAIDGSLYASRNIAHQSDMIRAQSNEENQGPTGHRLGSASARASSPAIGVTVNSNAAAAASDIAPPSQQQKQMLHSRQRSRSAIASPTRKTGPFQFTVPDSSSQQPPMAPRTHVAHVDDANVSRSRSALRSYLSADSGDQRIRGSDAVHLPHISGNPADNIAVRVPSNTNSRSNSPLRAASAGGNVGSQLAARRGSDLQPNASPNFLPRPAPSFAFQTHNFHALNQRAKDDIVLRRNGVVTGSTIHHPLPQPSQESSLNARYPASVGSSPVMTGMKGTQSGLGSINLSGLSSASSAMNSRYRAPSPGAGMNSAGVPAFRFAHNKMKPIATREKDFYDPFA